MTTTITLPKWTIDANGKWVRRWFDLTTTPAGKSDKPSAPKASGRFIDEAARKAS